MHIAPDKFKKNGVGDTIFSIPILVFLVPAYLYMCSFQYEKGICDYYGIPEDLISVDISNNLSFCASVSAALTLIYLVPLAVVNVVFSRFIFKNPKLLIFMKYNSFALFVCFLIYYFVPGDFLIINCGIGAFLLLIANRYAYHEYHRFKGLSKIQTYRKIIKDYKNRSNFKFPLLYDFLNFGFVVKALKIRDIKVFIICLMIVLYSVFIGRKDAYDKEVYELYSNKTNWILLRKYGDNIIIKNFDPKRHIIGDSLIILKTNSNLHLMFVTKKTGHLMFYGMSPSR